MKTKLILIVLLLTLISSATATEYYVKIETQKVNEVTDNQTVWSTPVSRTLNLSESFTTFNDVSINFYSMQTSDMSAWFKITGGTTTDESMTKTTERCIKGDAQGRCSAINHVRLRLVDIVAKTTSGSTTTTTVNSTNPFNAYYYVDKQIPLKVDGTKTFDVAAYLTKNELTQDDAPEKVEVFFESNIPFGITVEGGTFEPKWSWSGNTVKYIIEESSTYTFTVKYKSTNPSGYSEDKVDKYKFITKGLKSGTAAVSAIASYDVITGDSKEIKMSQPGKFTGQEGVTISAQGADSFVFKFSKEGQYHIKFTSETGIETFVDFNVKPQSQSSSPAKPAETPAEEPTTANQVTNLTGGNNYLILIPIAAIVIGIVMMRKKKSFSRPKITPNKVQ